MAIAELSRIDRTVDIQATPERVWRALTDPHELATWFRVTIEGEIAPGAEVWMSSVLPQHAGQRWPVRIVEMTRPRRMVWQWHPGEIDPKVDYAREPQTTVTFTLEPSARGTRVSVSETGFDAITLERRAKAYADNTQGWTEVMAWLQEYAQTAR
jgi:uncharacterized protein YndB with AHSA1/START domain